MAYGLLCKHCGNSESAHINGDEAPLLQGYRHSLESCPGFEHSKRDYSALLAEYQADPAPGLLPAFLEKQLPEVSDESLLALEQQGRARAAWGAYSAHCFAVNEQRALSQLDDAIKGARDGRSRHAAIAKKDAFVTAARQAAYYVG